MPLKSSLYYTREYRTMKVKPYNTFSGVKHIYSCKILPKKKKSSLELNCWNKQNIRWVEGKVLKLPVSGLPTQIYGWMPPLSDAKGTAWNQYMEFSSVTDRSILQKQWRKQSLSLAFDNFTVKKPNPLTPTASQTPKKPLNQVQRVQQHRDFSTDHACDIIAIQIKKNHNYPFHSCH